MGISLIWGLLVMILTLVGVMVARNLSKKKFAVQRVVCFLWRHDLDKKDLVHAMGAVFRGSICRRCKRFKRGKYMFDIWDDTQTIEEAGVIHLSGINPRIEKEGWQYRGDLEQLVQISEMLCKKEKKKKKTVYASM